MDLDGLCFVRRGNALVPADIHADEMIGQIGMGREVIVTLRRARNPRHHRWFFALLRKVRDNAPHDFWPTEEHLLEALKEATGHYDIVRGLDGTRRKSLKSINFASMDQIEFKGWVDRCLIALNTALGIDVAALMAEVIAEQGAIDGKDDPRVDREDAGQPRP